jgi:hypothetical protein
MTVVATSAGASDMYVQADRTKTPYMGSVFHVFLGRIDRTRNRKEEDLNCIFAELVLQCSFCSPMNGKRLAVLVAFVAYIASVSQSYNKVHGPRCY